MSLLRFSVVVFAAATFLYGSVASKAQQVGDIVFSEQEFIIPFGPAEDIGGANKTITKKLNNGEPQVLEWRATTGELLARYSDVIASLRFVQNGSDIIDSEFIIKYEVEFFYSARGPSPYRPHYEFLDEDLQQVMAPINILPNWYCQKISRPQTERKAVDPSAFDLIKYVRVFMISRGYRKCS